MSITPVIHDTDPPVTQILKEYLEAVYAGRYATADYLHAFLPVVEDLRMITCEDAFQVSGEIFA